MARIDEPPETRYEEPVSLTQTVVCDQEQGGCGADWVHTFITDLIDVEQMVETPEDDVVCPHCDRQFHIAYEGWHEFGGA